MTEPDTIRLLHNGAEAFPAWLDAIAAARDEILLEMYWFESDATGRKFADALAARARDGLDVLVLYDAVGSLDADNAMFDMMRAAGADAIEFHPVTPWRKAFRLGRVSVRDHRKVLVVDGSTAFTGGINICNQAAPREEGGGGWRDDAVCVTGAAAQELRALFFDTWCANGGRVSRRLPPAIARTRREKIVAARDQLGRGTTVAHPALERGNPASSPSRGLARASPEALARAPQSSTIQVIGHDALGVRRSIRRIYVQRIREARRKILIANSYFIPDPTIRRALERAAGRGVEVRVIVPRKSDVPSVGYASRTLYASLLKAGVQLHEWVDGMLHSKTALIDGWATVGSYNLDYRSLLYNLEVNVASDEPEFASAMERSYRADLERCEQLTLEQWQKRPYLPRVLEWLHYLIRRLL